MNSAEPAVPFDRPAKIEDVAAGAGVSVATVSRAVRGLPNVAPATRERVLAVAASMNYSPDPHASRLAAGRTNTIAIAVPMLQQWYFAQVVGGVEAVIAEAGYDLLLYAVSTGEDRARFVREVGPLKKRADGLILVDRSLPDGDARGVADGGSKVVMIGSVSEWFPSLSVDNVAAARLATDHLIELGHRRIALLSGLPDDPLRFEVPDARRDGYQAALRAAGVEPDPSLNVPGNFSIEGGVQSVERLFSMDEPPTAIFAMSDEMAFGVIKAARAVGLRIPEDLSIVGFDDHEIADVLDLTTVAQPVVGTGARAARLLLDSIDGETAVAHEVIPVELVERRTTAPPAT